MTDRFLGLDYGDRRIGVAVSDGLGLTAQPHPFINADADAFNQIKKIVAEYDIKQIIVGLPKHLDGRQSEKAHTVTAWADELSQYTGCEIIFRDERLSTVAVTRTLIAADVSRQKRKSLVDSQAAAFILQGYLDTLAFRRRDALNKEG